MSTNVSNNSQKETSSDIASKIAKEAFVKVLRTEKEAFIYDVNLNTFFEVSPSIALLFENPHCTNISPQERKEAEKLILDFRKRHNVFSPSRPHSCKFAHSYECFEHSIRHKIEQIILNTTNRCNLRCKYCIYSGLNPIARQHSPKSMTKDVIHRALEFYLSRCSDAEMPTLGLYGGEPTLEVSLLRYAVDMFISARKGKPYLVSITTNGLGLTPELWEYFQSKNISLLVSVDGPPKIHDQYRTFPNGKGSFEMIAKNLEWGLKHFPDYYKKHVSLSITLAPPYKLRERSEFFSQWILSQSENNSVGYVDDIELDRICSLPDYFVESEENEEFERYKNSLTAGKTGTWLQRSLFQRDFLDIYKRSRSEVPYKVAVPNICIPGVRRLFVDVNGRFHLCEKVLPTCVIGDVWRGISEKRVYELAVQFASSLQEECCNCWAARFCTLCFVHAIKKSFKPEERKKNCDNVRNNLEKAMTSYCHILFQNKHAFDHLDDIEYG